ncbi:hypothetical protein [Oryza sativa Japonica Group]|uniref:Uncharacterized protein n=1 Tax=Oryza sativa subsp. japonica TaxID=39947 RepID=Q5QLQ2_ORYSJ|nr:hypothetical protein [Oryza sativa Japonica Group]
MSWFHPDAWGVQRKREDLEHTVGWRNAHKRSEQGGTREMKLRGIYGMRSGTRMKR